MKTYLTPLKKSKNLRKDIVFHTSDFESMGTRDRHFRCAAIASKNNSKKTLNTYYFEDFESYFKHIIDNEIKLIYFYNLNYDVVYFLNYFYENIDYSVHFIESGSMLLGLIVNYKGKHLLTLKDFYCYCVGYSLEIACKSFNVKTKKFNVDFDNCTNDEIKQHVINDVIMLRELIDIYRKNLFETDSVDVLSKRTFSLASLAVKSFRTNYITEQIENPFIKTNLTNGRPSYSLNERLDAFVRKTYKGGYCNATDQDLRENTISVDANSFYPAACIKEKFPTGFATFTDNYNEFKERTTEICGFCEVILNITEECIVSVIDSKLVPVIGTVKVNITSYELNYALECGATIIEFIEGVYFSDYDKTFALSRYMEEKYLLKKNAGSDEIRTIQKMFLNALTGKFGQKPTQKGTCIEFIRDKSIQEFADEKQMIVEQFSINDGRDILKGVVKYEKESTSLKTFMNVAWISIITAKCRVTLIKLKKQVNGHYCDTDSLHLIENEKNMEILAPILDNKKMGFWKIEEHMLKERCLAPKMYVFLRDESKYSAEELKKLGGVKGIRAKGIPRKKQLIMWEDLMRYPECELSITTLQILSYKGALVSITNISRDGPFGAIREVTKTLNPKVKEIKKCEIYEKTKKVE